MVTAKPAPFTLGVTPTWHSHYELDYGLQEHQRTPDLGLMWKNLGNEAPLWKRLEYAAEEVETKMATCQYEWGTMEEFLSFLGENGVLTFFYACKRHDVSPEELLGELSFPGGPKPNIEPVNEESQDWTR